MASDPLSFPRAAKTNPAAAASPSSIPGLFFRLFPVPKFLKMPADGLEISDSALRLVRLEQKPLGVACPLHKERLLPPGTIAAGEILKRDVLVRELSSFLRESKTQFVLASIPDEKAYFFTVRLSPEESSDIRQGVEFKLEENVPLPAGEALFECKALASKVSAPAKGTETEKAEPAGIDVAAVALPREVVQNYSDVIKEAGATALSFTTPSHALVRALVPKGNLRGFLVVHIGEKKTTMAVAANNAILYATTVAIGSEQFTSALERSFSVKTAEAIALKSKKSFIRNRENSEFFSALISPVSALLDEVRKVIAYWNSHASSPDFFISRVICSGTDASIVGLDEYLSVALKVEVGIGNPWQNILENGRSLPPVNLPESLHFAAAIGLALADLPD